MSEKNTRRRSGSSTPGPGAVGVVEERCPICLDDFKDKAFVSSCFHSFCFECVVRAAQSSGNVCPMCKTKFTRVIHNVRANDDYDLYNVPVSTADERNQVMRDMDEAIRQFRGYRTTMHAGGRAPSGHVFSGNAPGRSGSGSVLVHINLPPSSSSSHTHYPHSHFSHSNLDRDFGRNVRRSRRCAPPHFRRAVYAAGVHALPLEEGNSRRHKTRNISAAHFKRNPAGTHRLGPWLSREFEVLVGVDQVEFMMQLVLSLIDKVDLESDLFGSHLEPFLNERTAHFMHEFISFAKSPFDIIAYDGKVRYNWPANYPVPAGHSGTSRTEQSGHGGSDASSGQSASTSSLPGSSSSGVSVHRPSQPGSGMGSQSMQQRIFSELVNDRLEPVSHYVVESDSSPIIIHGSDSESDEGIQVTRSKIELTYPSVLPGLSSSHASGDQAVPAARDMKKEQQNLKTAQPSQPSTSTDEISLFVGDDEEESFKRHHFHGDEREKDFGVMRDSGKGKGKMGSHRSKGKSLRQSDKSSTSSRRERHRHSPSWSELRRLKRRSSSRDSSEDDEERYEKNYKRKCRSRDETREKVGEQKYDRDRGHEKRRHISEKKELDFGDRDMEEDRDHKRQRNLRASSEGRDAKKSQYSDSDGYVIQKQKRACREASWGSEDRHEKRKKSDKHKKRHKKHRRRRSYSSSDAEERSEKSRKDEDRTTHEVPVDDTTGEQLMQEAKAIDDEIKASKREILKSALKKERIDLLHRQMRASSSEGVGVVNMTTPAEKAGRQQQVLQDELVQLNEKIVNEKKRLLKVVKHIEEEKGEFD